MLFDSKRLFGETLRDIVVAVFLAAMFLAIGPMLVQAQEPMKATTVAIKNSQSGNDFIYDYDAGSTVVEVYVWTKAPRLICSFFGVCSWRQVEGWAPAPATGGPVTMEYLPEPIPWLPSTNYNRAVRFTVQPGFKVLFLFSEGSRAAFFTQKQLVEFNNGEASYTGRLGIGAYSEGKWRDYSNVLLCSGKKYGNYVTESWRSDMVAADPSFWIGETVQNLSDNHHPTWNTGIRYELDASTTIDQGQAVTTHMLTGVNLPSTLHRPRLGFVMEDHDGECKMKAFTIAGVKMDQ